MYKNFYSAALLALTAQSIMVTTEDVNCPKKMRGNKYKGSMSEDQINAVLENEKVQAWFQSKGFDCIPEDKGGIDDFIAELNGDEEKFKGCGPEFDALVKELYPNGVEE